MGRLVLIDRLTCDVVSGFQIYHPEAVPRKEKCTFKLFGDSSFLMKPFYRLQQVDGDDVQEDVKTNGLEFSLFRDNRDFRFNPSRAAPCG